MNTLGLLGNESTKSSTAIVNTVNTLLRGLNKDKATKLPLDNSFQLCYIREEMDKLSWSFAQIWNESLEQREERKLEPRQHIWASELGGPFIDRWYKMKGVEPSNPFDPRSLRKFEAGRVFEWLVEMVLARAGILKSANEWVEYQVPGGCRITGKLDHLAGGFPDWEKAKTELSHNELPPFILKAAGAVIEYFQKKYPKGLKDIILEVKSVGSNKFHRYETFKVADIGHSLQLFHYLKAKNMPEGHMVYISKDDLCLAEIGVLNPSPIGKLYEEDARKMKEYLGSKTPPPKENPIYFDEVEGKFVANWKIGYSQYLTMLYGYKNQKEFETKYKPIVARWNRVLGRIASDKKPTVDNQKAVEEMKVEFPTLEELIKITKKSRKEGGGEGEGDSSTNR